MYLDNDANIISNIVIILSIIIIQANINGNEKLLIQKFMQKQYGNSDIVRRPCEECASSDELECLGMPSGHTESATVFASLLLFAQYINFPIWSIIIIAVGLQRVIYDRHTINQVIAGFIMGSLYSGIYISFIKRFCKSCICLPVVIAPLCIYIVYTYLLYV
jgi:PAP2 superfamily